jgi:hypothetical protein
MPLRTLILTLAYPHTASYYDDWRDAFLSDPSYVCTVQNILDLSPHRLARLVDDFDAVVMLHSCNSDTLDYFAPLAAVLGERKKAKLLTFVGNEYNSPYVSSAERVRLIKQARCDLVATQLLVEAGEYLYGASGARVISAAHALNPSAFVPGPDSVTRPLDLGVKGYRYPPFLGDNERNTMLRFFGENAERLSLKVDISEDKRLDRGNWARYLQSCRGTISTETGSWYISPNDEFIGRIHDYMASKRTGLVIKNDNLLRRMVRRLPTSIKALMWQLLKVGPIKFEILEDFNTTFEELDERFFKHAPRAPVYSKAISSRHFDAVGCQTCQVMLAGRYNDLLEADTHYLSVAHDYSNIDDVVRRFKDKGERDRITARAHEHVMNFHTYAHRTKALASEIRGL